MLRFFAFMCALAAVIPGYASGQSTRARGKQQIADSIEIAELARTLTRGTDTDSARGARLYEWVAHNLDYDVKGFLEGRLSDGKPEDVYRTRLAVCSGFVALFERLAHESGLEVVPILGYAKGFTYRNGAPTKKPNHSWLALRLNGEWRLVDPTWGAGVVANNKFEPRFTWDYYLVDPNELVFTHFPEAREWQLLNRPMQRADFERLPMVHRTLFDAGFDASQVRATALANRVQSFPLVGTRRDVRIVVAPLNGVLARDAKVNVEIIWPGAADVALVSGGIWRHLVREGDHFRGEAVALASVFSLVGRGDGRKDFETLLQYQVQ
jgi:hypothetical protein